MTCGCKCLEDTAVIHCVCKCILPEQKPKPYLQTTAGRYAGPGHVRGYPGLVHTAKPISRYIPKCRFFIEPLAGLGRIARQVQHKCENLILNDLSDYAYDHNKREFPDAIVTQVDFVDCVKEWDAKGNVIFFDSPWSYSEYKNGAHGLAICTMKPSQYYDIIFEMLPSLKSDWFVAGNKNNSRLKNSGYPYKLIEAEDGAKIMGGLIKTALISNKEFRIE